MSMAWLSWEMKTCLTGKEENIACRKNLLLCKNLVGKGFFFFLMTVFFGQSFQEYQNHLECFIIKKLVLFSYSVMSNSLQPHGLQHTRLPCSSPSPGVYQNPCPLSRWCHPTISSSVIPFSSCLQSFPALGSFLMSQLFRSGSQSIGASASVVSPSNDYQYWFPLGLTGLISLQSKGISRVFSNTTGQKHQFFNAQLSL